MKSATQHKLNSNTNAGYPICILIISSLFLFSCNDKKKPTPALFEALTSKSTGIDFVNKLTPTAQFNMFKYMYFYNGAGVGVGGAGLGLNRRRVNPVEAVPSVDG